MLVTVIVPAWNGEKYIEKCVDSLMRQTYHDFEIVLYDDASSDRTREIMKRLEKEHPSQIRAILADHNRGVGGAKNGGFEHARGDYVTFVDCDDYIASDYLEAMMKPVLENPSLDLVITDHTKVREDECVICVRNYQTKERAFAQKVFVCSKLYRRKWMIENGLQLPSGKVLDDVLLHVKQLLCDPVYTYVPHAGYYYVEHATSVSHTTLASFKEGAIDEAMKYLIQLKKLAIDDKKKEILVYYAFQYICWHLLKSGSGVGKTKMMKEYELAFSYLYREFPEFKKNRMIGAFGYPEERGIVHFVMWSMRLLEKLHLIRLFLSLYSRMHLQKLWPNS